MYFFYFLRQGRAEISHQGKYLKFENMKLSHSIFISWNSIYLCIRDRAFNWQSAFWNNVVTCFSKNSLLSVSMRNSVTVFSESLHKKWSFPLKNFSVNLTKYAVSCGFGQFTEKPLMESFIFCAASYFCSYQLEARKSLLIFRAC